ncbi:MAG: lipopolysaccharide transport system permease protein [Solirubrobacteraceae bacterium]|nr:lipopolysaccharide transport system permease protein [Solirubrobacteraceae bacterium]
MSGVRELLRYRYLFAQLVRRELRQKYQGSALGVLWYVINPLVLMGAYYLMFGVIFKTVSHHDYPLFLMVGLVVWIFFSQSLLSAAPSLLDQGALIRKVRFPRETIPASVVTVQLITFVVVFALVTVITVVIVGTVSPELLLLVPLVVALFMFALGLGLIVSILHAYFRDVAPILSAALLPWFFISPIFFTVGDLGVVRHKEWARIVLTWVNPIAPFITAVRKVVYDGVVPPAGTLLYVGVAALVIPVVGAVLFRRLQGELAVVL